MPRIEPYTEEWDKKLDRIAASRIGWGSDAAQAYAWMQCDRDFWKELYIETLQELNAIVKKGGEHEISRRQV